MAKGNPDAKAAMTLHQRTGISLKAAWAKVRGRGGGGSTVARRSASSGSSKEPKLGSAWQGSMIGIGVLAPVSDAALHAAQDKSTEHFVEDVKYHVLQVPYVENVAVEIATGIVDKKMGQAAALSRNSVTAWAPELLNAARAGLDAKDKVDPIGIHGRFIERRNGYNPVENSFGLTPELVEYRVAKHGGQIFRKIRTKSAKRGGIVAKMTDKVGDFLLKPFGLTW